MESATLTRDTAGTRDAGDTRPTEAALGAALTTDICQEHVRQQRTAAPVCACFAIVCSDRVFSLQTNVAPLRHAAQHAI